MVIVAQRSPASVPADRPGRIAGLRPVPVLHPFRLIRRIVLVAVGVVVLYLAITFVQVCLNFSQIEGTFKTANGDQAFQVDAADNGQPGGGRDTFTINSVSYSNTEPLLQGGDIQTHSTTCL